MFELAPWETWLSLRRLGRSAVRRRYERIRQQRLGSLCHLLHSLVPRRYARLRFDLAQRAIEVILVCGRQLTFDIDDVTHMKGRTTMQRIAQIAWKKEGARQAQVEFHCPVPRVTPAAIKAPTLRVVSRASSTIGIDSLVEVLQYGHSPRSPRCRECLGQVHRRCYRCTRSSQSEDCSPDNKHGNILRRALDDDAYNGD